MATLGIDFQEGFDNDAVVVTIDGKPCFRAEGLRTKRVLGVAQHTSMNVDPGAHAVEISVTTRGVSQRLEVDVRDELHLGISLRGRELQILTRKERFGYG